MPTGFEAGRHDAYAGGNDVRLYEFGKTEIENLHASVGRIENVFGLQIAVDDRAFVRRCQTMRKLHRVVEHLADWQRTRDAVAQRRPLQELRHDVRGVVMAADVVDGQK